MARRVMVKDPVRFFWPKAAVPAITLLGPHVRPGWKEGSKDSEWQMQAFPKDHPAWVKVTIHRLLISMWNRKSLNSFAARQWAG